LDVVEAKHWRFRDISLVVGNLSSMGISVADHRRESDPLVQYEEVLEIVEAIRPSAAVFTNVAGLMHKRLEGLRLHIGGVLESLGYQYSWRVIDSLDYGLPQSRRRTVLLAFLPDSFSAFVWPVAKARAPTVGEALLPLMAENGWRGANQWARLAAGVAPTIVGGSKRHGGADLGPTRSKELWYAMGVDARGIADAAPTAETPTREMPRLTNSMLAVLQGFPMDWRFSGRKTSVYRQIASSIPPPIVTALGLEVRRALTL